MQQYFPLLLLAVAAIALFVLPARQRKRVQAQQQSLRDSLAPGTKVMTTSGLFGTVVGKGEGTIDLEIAPGVVVTFTPQAVLEVRKPSVDLGKPGANPALPSAGDATPGDPTTGTDGRPTDGSR
jgi:preprotein translocase subunit YajC